MTFEITDERQTFCWLRTRLEPRYRVVAEPDASYYSEHKFCYRVYDGAKLLREFRGDFRTLVPQTLLSAARAFVHQLEAQGLVSDVVVGSPIVDGASPQPLKRLITSRLVPLRQPATYFSSGRAAFTWMIRDAIRPKRVWLPTFVCWSLIQAMQQRFPQMPLMFYSVDRKLQCQWPKDIEPGDALVYIHYFGHVSKVPDVSENCVLLEDVSHQLLLDQMRIGPGDSEVFTRHFADGGIVYGRHSPVYESDDGLSTWLRGCSRDWRDLREAENMMDRGWRVSDMSSQSLAQMLASNPVKMADQRCANQRFLQAHLAVGEPLIRFCDDEVPLLHNILMPDPESRDSLRSFLASRGIFCSIHWPLHPLLRDSATVDSKDAAWLEDHVLSIPVADDFDLNDMTRVVEAAREWTEAGR
ncbi:MAG: hypothetical protein U0936_03085 [Planctomycetaceae bacterium]